MKNLWSTTLLLIGALAAVPQTGQAQFLAGDNVVNFGAGFNVHVDPFDVYDSRSSSPVLTVGYERATGIGVGPGVLGIGGQVAYQSYRYRYTYTGDYVYSYYYFAVRGAYHYNEWHGKDNLDTYGGVRFSFRAFSDNYNGERVGIYGSRRLRSRPSGSVFVGARYYFTQNIGVYVEFSSGIAVATGGLAFKF